MIFQRSSKDLICVSNCHSKSFASPLFCWSQGGWHLVLKQSLRTILPRVSLSCLPPGNTDWSNSPGSRTYTFLVCTCFHICGIITSYNELITCKRPYENYEERKCPGSPNSKWTLTFLCIKLIILPSLNLLMMNSRWSRGLWKVPVWSSTSSVMELRIWKRKQQSLPKGSGTEGLSTEHLKLSPWLSRGR